ncbi:transporter [Bacteroidota bacterium]
MKISLLYFFLFVALIGKAQDNTPELITDRPDQTESSAVVPHKSLQIESGFVMENDDNVLSKQKSFAYNTTLLRYGLFENMELRLGLGYFGDKEEFKNSDTVNTISGLSPIYTGFKIKITEEKEGLPEIAFLGGLVLPFTASEEYKPSYSAANIRFSLSHTLSERFSAGYNIGAEWDGESAIPGYFYSIVLGIGLADNLGMFIESFGLIPEEGNSEHLADAGFTFLLFPNLQFDVSGGIGINDESIDNFIGVGVSYRIPK